MKKTKKLNLPWFQHSVKMSEESKGIVKLLDESGKEMYANYILLLELFGQNYNGTKEITISKYTLSKYLRIRNANFVIEKVLKCLSVTFDGNLQYAFEGKFNITLSFPKMLELFQKSNFNICRVDIKDSRVDITTTTAAPINTNLNSELKKSEEKQSKIYFDYEKLLCIGIKESGMIDKWKERYTWFDVMLEIKKACDYLVCDFKSNGKKCDNLLKFLNGWMKRVEKFDQKEFKNREAIL